MRLTCDDCGSVQSGANARCELCGGSLGEERERHEQGSVVALTLAAIGATTLLCIVPGIVIYAFWFGDWGGLEFALAWAAVWVVGGFLAQYYSPRDDYDFGWRTSGYGFVDNPFTLRDNRDRAHAGLGLVLFPIGVVSGLWVALFRRFFSSRSR